jgi:zinc protease
MVSTFRQAQGGEHGRTAKRQAQLLFLFLAAILLSGCSVEGPPTKEITIPYTKFVLDNGLTLIVHEDHKAPIVAVNVWYHVGSKNEKPGKTGLAHLFEHLMFYGSEHFNDDYFKALEKVGATDRNGTTSEDRTNYFESAPKEALDYLLWLESDRMGHLLGALTQAKLDAQRGVVQNEKRQRDNQPYSIADELIIRNTWPAGHPYSWPVLGSMEDLNAASLDDAKEWFRAYYGAANATLVVAGDVKSQEAFEKVKKHFGHIPSGPPVARHELFVAKRTGTCRMKAQDRVPQARLYMVWNIPQYGTTEGNYLDLVSDVLSSGRSSRLYKRLVYQDQIATSVSAYVYLREIAGQFLITATVEPGGDLAKVENAVKEELARFLEGGPALDELLRIKTRHEASFIRGLERIGGKAAILAGNFVFTGSPEYYKTAISEVREATAQNLLDAAQKWLSDGVFILEIHPFASFTTDKSDVDRSRLPVPVLKPGPAFPTFRRTALANGLKIVFAERHAVPVVNFNLQLDAGYAADQLAVPGTARLAMNMLTQGTKTRNSLQISDECERLGASISSGNGLDVSSVWLSALKKNLDASLELYADVILNPSFSEGDFQRLRALQLAGIQREKAAPSSMAWRVFPQLLYGRGHAYGFPASGFEAGVSKLEPADIKKFYEAWFKPNNATLIIVGNATLNELTPKLERLFNAWRPGTIPAKKIAPVAPRTQAAVYLIDRPGSQQSVVYVGSLAPPRNNPDEIAIKTMNSVLGGASTSRVNMNLREGKHWAYGAFTGISQARGQRPFYAYAPVQTDKTRETLVELSKELRSIIGDKPPTDAEVAKIVTYEALKQPGIWETMSSVGGALADIVQFGLPDNYYQTYPDKVRSLTKDDVAKAARTIVHPEHLVWLIVGDRAKIEPGIRELNYGPIAFLDADGNTVTSERVSR